MTITTLSPKRTSSRGCTDIYLLLAIHTSSFSKNTIPASFFINVASNNLSFLNPPVGASIRSQYLIPAQKQRTHRLWCSKEINQYFKNTQKLGYLSRMNLPSLYFWLFSYADSWEYTVHRHY